MSLIFFTSTELSTAYLLAGKQRFPLEPEMAIGNLTLLPLPPTYLEAVDIRVIQIFHRPGRLVPESAIGGATDAPGRVQVARGLHQGYIENLPGGKRNTSQKGQSLPAKFPCRIFIYGDFCGKCEGINH